MAKRTVATIKQYDYTSKEEFLKDVDVLREKGYHLIENNGWAEVLKSGELDEGEAYIWKYTAYFVKSDMM